MSEQVLTVNGAARGVKKTIVLPSRPKKRLFIGMLSLVTLLTAALLFAIWYIGVPGLARIQPMLPWGLGALLSIAVLVSFFGIFNMVLAIAGLPYVPWMKRQTYELINLLFPAAVRLGAVRGQGGDGNVLATDLLSQVLQGVERGHDGQFAVLGGAISGRGRGGAGGQGERCGSRACGSKDSLRHENHSL